MRAYNWVCIFTVIFQLRANPKNNNSDDDKKHTCWINFEQSLYQSRKLKEGQRIGHEKTGWSGLYFLQCYDSQSMKHCVNILNWGKAVIILNPFMKQRRSHLKKFEVGDLVEVDWCIQAKIWRIVIVRKWGKGLNLESNDKKSMNHLKLACALQPKWQQDKKLSSSTNTNNSTSTASSFVVVKQSMLQTATISHIQPNVPVVSTVKANDVPLVSSLHPSCLIEIFFCYEEAVVGINWKWYNLYRCVLFITKQLNQHVI